MLFVYKCDFRQDESLTLFTQASYNCVLQINWWQNFALSSILICYILHSPNGATEYNAMKASTTPSLLAQIPVWTLVAAVGKPFKYGEHFAQTLFTPSEHPSMLAAVVAA